MSRSPDPWSSLARGVPNDRPGRPWARLLAWLEGQDATLRSESNPLREVALTAALTADRVDRLEVLAVEVEPYIVTEKGGYITHPVLVEVRPQANLRARLVASLRLPDQKTVKRTPGPAAAWRTRPHAVSSLERARAWAEDA